MQITAVSSPVAPAAVRESAEKTAREFEAVFLAEMLRPVFDQVNFGGGQAEQIFKPMLIDAYGQAVAEAGGIGIADSLLHEILRMKGL